MLHGDDPSSVAAVHDASPVDVGGEEGVRHAHRQHRVADVETRPHLPPAEGVQLPGRQCRVELEEQG